MVVWDLIILSALRKKTSFPDKAGRDKISCPTNYADGFDAYICLQKRRAFKRDRLVHGSIIFGIMLI